MNASNDSMSKQMALNFRSRVLESRTNESIGANSCAMINNVLG